MSNNLKPFWAYYGGKWRAAPYYPAPRHDIIIEPFAGAAGYSLRYADRNVILVERNPKIAAIWRYLLRVSAAEIRALPLIASGQTVNDFSLCEEARYLIGMSLGGGSASPLLSPTAWMRNGGHVSGAVYWGEAKRERIASQVDRIRHWTLIEGDYANAPDVEATWFIDPPYVKGGQHYPTRFRDYEALASWCRTRSGQVMVCESEGAEWLPFREFRTIKTNNSSRGKGTSREVIWTNER